MYKDVAGQSIGAELVNKADGTAFTGAVTVYITGDNNDQAIGSVGGGLCTHKGRGYHNYLPSQAETNFDLIAFTFVGDGAVPVTIQVPTVTAAAQIVQVLPSAALFPLSQFGPPFGFQPGDDVPAPTTAKVWGLPGDTAAFEQEIRLAEDTDNVIGFTPSSEVASDQRDIGSDTYVLRVSRNEGGNEDTDEEYPAAVTDADNGAFQFVVDADPLAEIDTFFCWSLYRTTGGSRQCRGRGILLIDRTSAVDPT